MESRHLETDVWPEGESPLPQTDVDDLYQQSLLHLQDGRWQEAIAGFEEVLRLRPDHTEARLFLELDFSQLGSVTECVP